MGGSWIVVSVHDVAPAFTAEVQLLLGALDAIGVRPRVLKVVPHAAGGPRVDEAPALVRLLHDETRAGSEVVLHGYTHQGCGAFRGDWLTRARAHLFAGPAAEFLTLDPAEAGARLVAGRTVLQGLGINVQGFCAPAWMASKDTRGLLQRLGFRYYVGMNTLVDVQTGRRRWLPWAGYMGASPWHERLVWLGGAVQLAVAARFPAIKVFLHPQRARASTDCQRVLRLLARLVHERRPTTYAALLDAGA